MRRVAIETTKSIRSSFDSGQQLPSRVYDAKSRFEARDPLQKNFPCCYVTLFSNSLEIDQRD